MAGSTASRSSLRPLNDGWAPLLQVAHERLGREVEGLGGWDPAALPRLQRFLDAVAIWTGRTDLTAARTAEEHVDLSLADAWVLAAQPRLGSHWVDVGSGGGAPGLVLALLDPALNLQLVEPRLKRVAFLRQQLGAQGLDRVSIRRGRSDELAPASFEEAVSRATLPPTEWLAEGARLATKRVWVLLARGEEPSLGGWRRSMEVAYRLPFTGVERRIVAYEPEPAT